MIPSPAELSFGETRIHISYVEIPRSCVSSVLNYCIFVSYCAVATFHVTRAQLESKDYGIISTLFEPKHGYHFDRPYSHLVHTHTLSRREPRQRPESFAFYDTRNPPSSLISRPTTFPKALPVAVRHALRSVFKSPPNAAVSHSCFRVKSALMSLAIHHARFPSQPPFRAPALPVRSLSFLRSPSRTFFIWFRTCTFCAEPLQSSGRYGGEMMTASWAIISVLCQRMGMLL